jgi:hypothetical protein
LPDKQTVASRWIAASAKKYLSFAFSEIMISSAPSRLDKRDVRVVTNVRQDAMDVVLVARRAAWTRTAKACGPGAPRLALSARGDDLAGDGD